MAPGLGMEENVARTDGAARHFVLPTVITRMLLIGLPKLKWILEGVHTLEWPSLKELETGECALVNVISASSFSSSDTQETSQHNLFQTCIQQPIFLVKEGTFPKLEILSLSFNPTIWPSKFSDFPPSFLVRMPNLLELYVSRSGWEEIFPYDQLLDREIQVMTVPRLRKLHLHLHLLPMLTHLWKEDTQPCPIFHTLDILTVSRCAKLKILVPSSISLQTLTILEISNCHGLINLVTSSTARNLLQLKEMTISECKRIIEIVAMGDGETNVAITFNKLTCLQLNSLPNLTNFCSGAYSFGFPSLEKVIVKCCPEMKTFCHGVLSTPKLKGVDATTEDNSHWEHDLNTTTHWLWESDHYDTQLLFRERVENCKDQDEDHP